MGHAWSEAEKDTGGNVMGGGEGDDPLSRGKTYPQVLPQYTKEQTPLRTQMGRSVFDTSIQRQNFQSLSPLHL